MTPHHACSGHRCLQILTCDGMRESSYNWRKVFMTLGGAIFGFIGCLGAVYKHPGELRAFGSFLAAAAALLLLVALGDGAYTTACGAYPYNVVNEALMWPLPNVPVRNGMKYEIVVFSKVYPVDLVRQMIGWDVLWLYFLVELCAVLFCAYAAQAIFQLAGAIHFGLIGMGPTFDMAGWYDQASAKDELKMLLQRDAGEAFPTSAEAPKYAYGSAQQVH